MAVTKKLRSNLLRVVVSLILSMVELSFATAETAVPNEFSSGLPAKAQEVNENFDSLESAIDEHWTRYPDRYYPNWRYEKSFTCLCRRWEIDGERGLTVNMAMARLVSEI